MVYLIHAALVLVLVPSGFGRTYISGKPLVPKTPWPFGLGLQIYQWQEVCHALILNFNPQCDVTSGVIHELI